MNQTPRAAASQPTPICICPVCEAARFEILAPLWRNYHREGAFFAERDSWFAQCAECGVVVRFPLLDYGTEFTKYGEDYYNQGADAEGLVDHHAQMHFEQFQKPNYDAIRELLRRILPAATWRHWLDVGSVGYATTFDDYDFTTIEPDDRVVKVGRRLFVGYKLWNRAKIQCATLESFDAPRRYDGILFNNSFYCVPTPARTLQKAASMLNDDGRLVISIGTYLNGAVAQRDDGLVSRLEDVIPGETLWVYYNRHSLRYLAARFGFELESEQEITAYGHKTMIVYVFRKSAAAAPEAGWLADSKAEYARKWQACFEAFREQTRRALEILGNPRTIVLGETAVVLDLARAGDLGGAGGIALIDSAIANTTLGTATLTSWDALVARLQEAADGEYTIALCVFREPYEALAKVRGAVGNRFPVLWPNRRSGIPGIDLLFNGELRPGKGLHLVDAP